MTNEMGTIWRFDGRVTRGTYALFGFCGVAIKHNLDRVIAKYFKLDWGVWNYLVPVNRAIHSVPLTNPEKLFLATLLITSLPFIWLGITLTAKRLRDAGHPLWLVLLFFAPVLNVIFFLLLCALPSCPEGSDLRSLNFSKRTPSPYWPTTRVGSAALASVGVGLFGVLMAWGALRYLGDYGLTLFVSLPFVMGYLSVLIYSRSQEIRSIDVLAVISLSVLITAVGILAVAVEGFVCLIMAAPFAWVIALFGGILAKIIHGRGHSPQVQPSTYAVLLIAIPAMFGIEHAAPLPVPHFQVRTTIEIMAPPDAVWRRLIQFPPLPTADEWPFRAGIAYPIEARLRGEGLTADRECRFSTGSFKEPILVWEPGKRFAFSVSDEPLLMKETSPYSNIHVRHLQDHDFQPERAEFVLVPLANGGTKLEGITTYQNRMWPGLYWRIWSDAIIHSIHHRVFNHVKNLAESDVRQAAEW